MKKLFYFGALVLAPMFIHGEPQGFQLAAGDASKPVHSANGWTIESGSNAIIHWDSFSVAAGETLQFLQANANSGVLNRVLGNTESQILGQLLSNGKVFLVNPNGVLIGPDARIETASFIASTLDALDDEFLQMKEMRFAGDGKGSIVNLGKISCPGGDILLLAKSVTNQGALIAGYVGLGVGTEILIKPEGTQRMFIQASESMESTIEGAALENAGKIEALAVELRTGSNPYMKAIRASGEIQANAIEKKGGSVFLVAESGITEVDNASIAAKNNDGVGGTVHVLGDKVSLLGTASIDVSGSIGGGEILIGGDFQGNNPEIKNAKFSYVGKDAVLKGDALESGNGGKIITWSDGATYGYGSMYARGGANGGDGGLVEVSGHYLDFIGVADTRAPVGQTGTLLLDPSNITIQTAGTDTGNFTDTTGLWTPNPIATTGVYFNNIITTGSLTTALGVSNVVITTTAPNASAPPPNGTEDTGIVVADTFTWADNSLTLQAASSITVNAAITATGAGSMNFIAGGIGGYTDTATTINLNGINVNAAITSDTGNITFKGAASGTGNGVTVGSAVLSTSGIITFQECVGSGTGGTGVFVQAAVTSTSGQIVFTNCSGQGTDLSLSGIVVNGTGSLIAPTISARGITCQGGNVSQGIFIAGGTIGNSTTTSLILDAECTCSGANAMGISFASGTLQVGASGTMSLYGKGSRTGTSSAHGIQFQGGTSIVLGDDAVANFTGIGGGGGVSFGIDFGAEVTMGTTGTLNFNNCVGGTGGSGFGASLIFTGTPTFGSTATNINFNNCVGGQDTVNGNNVGARLLSGINITTGTASLTFNNIAGGLGGASSGVTFSNEVSLTNGSVLFDGVTGGPNGSDGVQINNDLTVTTGSITFRNITGGTGLDSCNGINLTVGTIDAPTISAYDVMGGAGANTCYGLTMGAGTTLGTANTTALFIEAGSLGTGNSSAGIFCLGTIQVGDTGVMTLIGNGSLNNPTNSFGLAITTVSSALILGSTSGATASATLSGNGGNNGGPFGVAVTGNITLRGTSTLNFNNCIAGESAIGNSIGLLFGPTAFTFDTGSTVNINVSNCNGGNVAGATSTGGSNVGAFIGEITTPATTTVNFNFSNIVGGTGGGLNHGLSFDNLTVPDGTLTFNNISGGNGTTNRNCGIIFTGDAAVQNMVFTGISGGTGGNENHAVIIGDIVTRTVAATGSISFSNVVAGGTGLSQNNNGIEISTGGNVLSAATITGLNVMGGSGSENNNGVHIGPASTLSTTGNLSFTAGSLGTDGSTIPNSGIYNEGTISCGGVLSLFGTGSGTTGGTGILLETGIISTTSQNLILQGVGSGNSGFGVRNTTGTIGSTSGEIRFQNCLGSSTGLGTGVSLGANVASTAGSILFTNCTGSSNTSLSGSTGVSISATIVAPSIIFTDIISGPGNSSIGMLLSTGAQLGNSTTNTVSITAAATGSGANASEGLRLDGGIQVGVSGTIVLNGTAGQGDTGNNIGINFSSTSILNVGNGGSISFTGVGGSGVGGSNYGVSCSGLFTMGATGTVNFTNCVGGSLSGLNSGVLFSPNAGSTWSTLVSLNFTDCRGGAGSSNAGLNHGVDSIGIVTIPSANATFTRCVGGTDVGSSELSSGDDGVRVDSFTVTNGSIVFDQCRGGSTGGAGY